MSRELIQETLALLDSIEWVRERPDPSVPRWCPSCGWRAPMTIYKPGHDAACSLYLLRQRLRDEEARP